VNRSNTPFTYIKFKTGETYVVEATVVLNQ